MQAPVALVAGTAGTVILVLVVFDVRRASRYWHLLSSTAHHAIVWRIGVKAASAFVYICVSFANIVTINWLEWVFLILAFTLSVVSMLLDMLARRSQTDRLQGLRSGSPDGGLW